MATFLPELTKTKLAEIKSKEFNNRWDAYTCFMDDGSEVVLDGTYTIHELEQIVAAFKEIQACVI